MYLHNILQKQKTELIRKIYETQKGNPSPGDFSLLVIDDLKDIGMNITENQISLLSKRKFKLIVKNKVRDAAFKYLQEMKKKHSKMQLINYKTFKLQDYLCSPVFNNESRELLFRLRTRTINGIRSDFKGIYSDTRCPVGCGQVDSIPHILSCTVLGRLHKSTNISLCNMKFEDLFSEDVQKQKSITEMFRQLFEIRNEILSQPVAVTTGPMHNSSDVTTVLQSNINYVTCGK